MRCGISFRAVQALKLERLLIVLFVVGMVGLSAGERSGAGAADDASALAGTKTIRLMSADGQALEIGHVVFTPDGDGAARIKVTLDSQDFSDEFLSMRPFRCLSRPENMWCHLDYPYEIDDRVTRDDLSDLEYRLLFIWRPYDKVGIDAWNGLYFKLSPSADGAIAGALHEADYNVLAVPPEAGVKRPVTHDDLTAADPGQYDFARIEIR